VRSLTLVTSPDEEPVSLAEAKSWCQVDLTSDAVTDGLIAAARGWCEEYTRRAFVTQTWRLTLDAFPGNLYGSALGDWPWVRGRYASPVAEGQPYWEQFAIRLPRPPLQAVAPVTFEDGTGSLVTMDPAAYQVVGTDPGLVAPVYGGYWPLTRAQLGAVNVTFRCGYGGADAVPEGVKTGIKMLLRHWLENRAAAAKGGAAELPLGLKAALGPYRTGEYY
jgi:hypothetical protein